MSWAAKRQFQYLSGVLGVVALIALWFAYPYLTKKPTCFDGVQNGTETGVDCGGACSRVCTSEASEPRVLWSRAFNVVASNYNLVALVDNQNKNAGLKMVSYEFRMYDDDNLLIGRRQGTTYIPPNQQFVVFEPRFDSGAKHVKTTNFEFTSAFVWTKIAPTVSQLPIHVDQVVAGDDASSPTLTARVTNDSVYDIPAFDALTILYNSDKIAINASKTRKSGLASGLSVPLLFTWPQPFGEDPVTRDVLIQINPFTTGF